MLVPGIIALFLGLLTLGVLSSSGNPPDARRNLSSEAHVSSPTQSEGGHVAPTSLRASVPPLQAATLHLRNTWRSWKETPEYCQAGKAVNDFQLEKCASYRGQVVVAAAYAAIPLLVLSAFLLVVLDQFKLFYRRSDKKVRKGSALMKGVVTDPAIGSMDFFSWWFCLRPISVQLATRKQAKVYIPLDAPIPFPGQTLAVFDGGMVLGKRRYIATLYAPHLMVVQGVVAAR